MGSPARLRPALALTIGLAALPVAAAAGSLLGRRWYANSDQALELLRIADVGGGRTPLVGAGSRWGWAHPGPALFWLLAPFEWLFGQTGVLAGVAVLNLAAVAVAVGVGHRRGGLRVALPTALVLALLLHTLGLERVIDPWNPWAAFLPFVAFLLLTWSVLAGDLAMLPVAVAVGSFCVQCHVGYVPIVGGLLAVAAGWAVAATPRAAGRWLAIASATAVVVWLPPIVQQLTGEPGNIGAIADYVRDPGEPAAGWSQSAGVFGLQFRPFGPWVDGDEETASGLARTGPVWPALATAVLVAAGSWWAHRRGRRDAARLGAVALAAAGLGLIATARVTGLFVPYVFRWWWGIAAVASLALALLALGITEDRWRHRAGIARGAGFLALAVVVATTLADLPARLPSPAVSEALAELRRPVAAGLAPGGRYLVQGIDSSSFGAAVPGLFVQLERQGVEVFTDRAEGVDLSYGDWRAASPAEVDGIVFIVDLPDRDSGGWRPPPGSRLLAEWDPLTATERERASALEAAIRSALGREAPEGRLLLGLPFARAAALDAGADPADVEELRQLQAQGDGYAVYLLPAS